MHRHQGPRAGGNLWLLLPRTRLRCTRNQTLPQLLLSHGGKSRCSRSHRDTQHGKRGGHSQPRRRPLQNHLFSFAREDTHGVTVVNTAAQDQTGGTFPPPPNTVASPSVSSDCNDFSQDRRTRTGVCPGAAGYRQRCWLHKVLSSSTQETKFLFLCTPSDRSRFPFSHIFIRRRGLCRLLRAARL